MSLVPRPPLTRPRQGRLVAGVAAGLAVHLGVSVRATRVFFALSGLAGGFGVVLYGWLWAFVRTADADGAAVPVAVGGQERRRAVGPARTGDVRTGDVLTGGLLLLAGLAIVLARQGWSVPLGVVLPLLVAAFGAALAFTQLDEAERARWTARAGGPGRAGVLRVVGGLALVLAGVLLVVVRGGDAAYAWRVVVAVVSVLAGAALVLAPWAVRFWLELDDERTARAREAERADIAAHLHDSVLQTLTLIQRSSADPAAVTRLARAQERDLRGWLYGTRTGGSGTLAGQVRAAADEVEDGYGATVELVLVGDRVLDDRGHALVAALREAMVNAAKHAGGEAAVSVYVEAGPDGVEAFVRDRGAGFVVEEVPVDRLGVRESIVGRMTRHGGSAVVRSVPGEGTEVRLDLPDVVVQEAR